MHLVKQVFKYKKNHYNITEYKEGQDSKKSLLSKDQPTPSLVPAVHGASRDADSTVFLGY